MATLVVTLDFDHVVLASDKMHSALGYYSHHIDRRSIMILAGPKTDRNMLQNAMNEMTTQKLQLILYSASGAEQHVMVSCSSCMYGDFGSACLVVLHSSEAIPLSEAFGDCALPRVLVSAEEPNSVYMINQAFTRNFSLSPSEALGRPLTTLFFMHSEILNELCTSPSVDTPPWSFLLSTALAGRIARHTVLGDKGPEWVTCTPVVLAPNGRVSQLLVTFGPSRVSVSDHDAAHVQISHEALDNSTAAFRGGASAAYRKSMACYGRLAHDQAQGRTARAGGTVTHSPADQRGLPGLAIFPRRKIGGPPARRQPVLVTPELIAALADLPLREAAAAAGVSVTAFKKACRRLGVRRWAYKRRRPAAPTTPSQKMSQRAHGGSLGAERRAGAGAGSAAAPVDLDGSESSPSGGSGADTPASDTDRELLTGRPRCGDGCWAVRAPPLAGGGDGGGGGLPDLSGWATCAGWCAASVGAPASGGAESPRLFADPPAAADEALVLDMLRAEWALNGLGLPGGTGRLGHD